MFEERSSPSVIACPSALRGPSTRKPPRTSLRRFGRPWSPSLSRSLRSPSASANTTGCWRRSLKSTTQKPSSCARSRGSERLPHSPSCSPWRIPPLRCRRGGESRCPWSGQSTYHDSGLCLGELRRGERQSGPQPDLPCLLQLCYCQCGGLSGLVLTDNENG